MRFSISYNVGDVDVDIEETEPGEKLKESTDTNMSAKYVHYMALHSNPSPTPRLDFSVHVR